MQRIPQIKTLTGEQGWENTPIISRAKRKVTLHVNEAEEAMLVSKTYPENRRTILQEALLARQQLAGQPEAHFFQDFFEIQAGFMPDQIIGVYDFIPGSDCSRYFSVGRKPYLLDDFKDLLVQTSFRLDELQEAGLCHRDLKLQNIIHNSRTGFHLTDVEYMCRLGYKPPFIQGTPNNLAPEQVRLDPIEATTDIYALAALSAVSLGARVRAATGAFFDFHNETYPEYFKRKAEAKLCADREARNRVMDCLRDYSEAYQEKIYGVLLLVSHGLQPDPNARPQSGEEIRQLLSEKPLRVHV